MKKQKTIKAIAKRFKVTGSGKVLKRKDNQNHFNAKDTGKTTRQKRNDMNLSETHAKNIRQLLNK
jgi:large subunit ribosomal protein L35